MEMHIKLYFFFKTVFGQTSLLLVSKPFLLSIIEACALQSLWRIGNTIAKVKG